MIGRKSHSTDVDEAVNPQGFDDFDLRLGDVMRGERATMGKSLLDVQRELRIKASYIAAIENCDPSAFDTPGFIAGYVRSYARYLNMDPDEAFAGFCAESGFSVAHGMSHKASTIRKPRFDEGALPRARDPLAEPNMPFAPATDSLMSRIEPGAVGSSLVLIALIAGIGYGGWAVLQEVQRVQVSPVEQTPTVLSEIDPLDGAGRLGDETPVDSADAAGLFSPPTNEAFDRLYRPQALDVPVLVARDAPISTLDPETVGLFAGSARQGLPQVQDSSLAAAALAEGLTGARDAADAAPVQLAPGSGVTVIAARAAWVRVQDEEGNQIFSGILNAGDTVPVAADTPDPRIEVGESGAVYFAVNGTTYGPAGARGSVTSDLSLQAESITERYSPVETGADRDLTRVLASMQLDESETAAPLRTAAAPQTPLVPQMPQVLADPAPGVTIVATAETWVEVTAASGTKLIAKVMQPGETYTVPQTDTPPTVFSGNAGGVYFAVEGKTFGPFGRSGQFGRNLTLSPEDIAQKMAVADLQSTPALAKVVAELNAAALQGNQ